MVQPLSTCPQQMQPAGLLATPWRKQLIWHSSRVSQGTHLYAPLASQGCNITQLHGVLHDAIFHTICDLLACALPQASMCVHNWRPLGYSTVLIQGNDQSSDTKCSSSPPPLRGMPSLQFPQPVGAVDACPPAGLGQGRQPHPVLLCWSLIVPLSRGLRLGPCKLISYD